MTDEKFVHLHTHSYFSLLDGMSSIKNMVSCAADMGYKSLALTDHGTCAGLYQFQKVCKEKGIKPILGMEGYICADHTIKEKSPLYHIVLLAKNEVGYKNLIYLSSYGNIHGFYYKPRIDLKLLEAHKEGLIVSSACSAGEIARLVTSEQESQAEQLACQYKEIFKDDFYLEIMLHSYFTDKEQEGKEKNIANVLYKMGKKLGIKVIATQDSHYTRKEDWEAHDVLLSIQTLSNIKDPSRLTFGSNDFYLKPFEQMNDLFSKAPDVLSNTVEIAEKIGTNLILTSQDLLPTFKLPEGFASEEDYLKALVKRGMESKGLMGKQEYRDRIKMEMNVIIKCKYTKYFLILWDIVNYARSQNIRTGAGRGSAVSSLCLYVLDITHMDPLKYDLIFERFLNPDRISPPDVDMDFDYDRREEIYNYIIQKYGSDYCCQIGTYNKFKARAVIRSTAKALDIGKDWDAAVEKQKKNPNAKIEMTKNSLNIADTISKQIPFKANMTIEAALKNSEEFRESMHKYPKLLECARKIEDTLSSGGVHPAGILVCKDPVIDKIPLRNAKGVICSQYDGPEVEKLGLLKFDLLALKTLTVIDKTIKLIRERRPDKLPKDFDIDKLEPNDQKVFDILNGLDETRNALGIFQFEAHGISQLLKAIHVDRFEDMIVANALYRPGPLGAGMHDMYVSYKHKRKKIECLHPKMLEILKDTYGIMCFDGEQNIYSENNNVSIKELDNQKIYGLNKNKISSFMPLNKSSFITGRKGIYEYTLSNGFKIKCTKNHQFRLLDGNYKNIDDIYNDGDTIPYCCPSKSDLKGSASIMDRKFYYLIGLLVGDGNLNNSSPNLCCGNNKNKAKYVQGIFKDIYPDGRAILYWSTRSWYLRFSFPSNNKKWGDRKNNPLKQWLISRSLNVIGKYKRVPMGDIIKNRKLCLSFLAGYLDSDGCLSEGIAFTSSNENLLKDTTYILWRLGYRTYQCHHQIHVYESSQLYKELLPILYKREKTKILCNGSRMKLSSNMVAKIIIDDMGKMPEREYCIKNNLNRDSIRRIMSNVLPFCHYHTVKNILDKKNIDINNFACLLVNNKKYIGKKYVYDISMPYNTEHNFFVAPGVIVHNCYQEDIMKVSRVLAGFTGGQSDSLRKAIGKKDQALMVEMKKKFIQGCIENKIDSEIANKIFEQIEFFGGYGFNRSHSCAYSFIAYQTGWLKMYFPLEFMCNLLTSEINNNDKNEKLNMYIAAAERMKIGCSDPDINHSGLEFKIGNILTRSNREEVGLIKPLTFMKGVGDKAVHSIVQNQPYRNLEEFINKTDARIVNSRVFTTLVEAGCMKSWKIPKDVLLREYPEIKKKNDKKRKDKQKQEKEKEKMGGKTLFDEFQSTSKINI